MSASTLYMSERRNLSCVGSGRLFELWVLALIWGVVVCRPLLSGFLLRCFLFVVFVYYLRFLSVVVWCFLASFL